MLAPLAVQDRQGHAPLELAHVLLAELVLPGLVRVLGVRDDLGEDGLPRQVVDLARLLDDLVGRDRHRVHAAERGPERVEVPLVRLALGRRAVDVRGDDVTDEVLHLRLQVLTLEHAPALVVDHGALAGQDVVVLEDVLADLEVARLDLRLRAADAARDHLRLERDVVREPGAAHHRLGETRVEQAHEVVLHRQVEPGLTRVALAAGTTAELVVDAARLVPLGAQHVQPTERGDLLVLGRDRGLGLLERRRPRLLVLFRRVVRVQARLRQGVDRHVLGVAAEHDVGAAAGHVRGDRDGTLAARLRDDARLALVLLRVEDLVRDALLLQQARQELRLLDAGRADEDRLSLRVPLDDVVDDRAELAGLVLVDEVRLVEALHVAVRRDRDDAQLVGALELGGLGLGRTGHAGELLVQAEVVLQGDRGERLVLSLDLDALLRLDRLVHALVVAAAGQDAARVLVDDEDLAVEDDVVLVPLEQLLGLDGVVEEADQRRVERLVQVVDAEVVLDLLDAGLEHADRALLLVDLVVRVLGEAARDPCELRVPAVRVARRRARDDERGARLVDEDRVDLVDDREVVAALHELLGAPRHVVAQVVEAELVVRAVRDVGGVLLAALGRRLAGEDAARGQTQEPVHAAHEAALVLGQVVVDRDDVDALAGERVEVRGRRRDERLALTGLHLGDVAEVQGRATHELHVEVALPERAARRLAYRGERLGEDVVEGLPRRKPLLEPVGLLAQLGISELGEARLEPVDLRGETAQLLEDPSLADAKDLVDDRRHALLRSVGPRSGDRETAPPPRGCTAAPS